MGNCQAVDAAALVIQHPSGKVERLYWPITANEVMKMNPGHYVSLIIPIPLSDDNEAGPTAGEKKKKKTVRYTRVKLLRSSDTLVLGRAYRLVTSEEVKKVLMAKKKMNEKGSSGSDKLQKTDERKDSKEGKKDESENNDQRSDHARQRLTSRSMNSRSKTWRPSLQSISESTS